MSVKNCIGTATSVLGNVSRPIINAGVLSSSRESVQKSVSGEKRRPLQKRNKKSKQTTNKAAEYFDYAAFEEQAIAGLQSGAGLMGTEGVLTSLIQRLVNAALSGEMTGHLKSDKNLGLSNRRNGHLSKQLDTELGSVEIQTRYKRLGID